MSSTTRTAKRARFSSNIITIKVSSTRKEQNSFSIHEDVIKKTSPFFRASLDKKWKEGQAREIKLPDDSSEVVSCYVDWCYTKEMPSTKPGIDSDLNYDDIGAEYILLAELYAFGEKTQDDAFCDAVITAMAELVDQKLLDAPTRRVLAGAILTRTLSRPSTKAHQKDLPPVDF